jgi:hypothetical protein
MWAAPDNSQDKLQALSEPRLVAMLLAVGGCFWGLLLLPWLFQPDVSPRALAVFGPGYLVTLGYIVRSVTTPPRAVRYLIWASSILVQGAWLVWLIWAVTEQLAAGRSVLRDIANLMTAWWVFATAASVVGLLTEGPKQVKEWSQPSDDGIATHDLLPR